MCALFTRLFQFFLRYSELSELRMSDISFCDAYINVHIRQSKTDIYRRGNSVVIAKTGNKLCPVFWLRKYIEAACLNIGSNEYIFTSIQFCKKTSVYRLANRNSPLSYTRAREILLDALKVIGVDSSKYSLHSLRSGGVSAAAANKVPDRLLRAHGRWATNKSKDGYISDSLQHKLLVSRNLNL